MITWRTIRWRSPDWVWHVEFWMLGQQGYSAFRMFLLKANLTNQLQKKVIQTLHTKTNKWTRAAYLHPMQPNQGSVLLGPWTCEFQKASQHHLWCKEAQIPLEVSSCINHGWLRTLAAHPELVNTGYKQVEGNNSDHKEDKTNQQMGSTTKTTKP